MAEGSFPRNSAISLTLYEKFSATRQKIVRALEISLDLPFDRISSREMPVMVSMTAMIFSKECLLGFFLSVITVLVLSTIASTN